MQTLESLPVELIGEIFSVLDLQSLTVVPYLSRRLHHVCSDAQINPWRRPILRNLRLGSYEPCLKTLSVRTVVPRSNWIEILSIAGAHFLLFDATLPNLSDEEWRECFTRRFLPSMQQWKRQSSWREAFKKTLYRLWHRGNTHCTTDEAWQKYIALNKNGSANLLDAVSRGFSPLAIMDEMKLQSDLADHQTRVKVLVELADVRILALGVLHDPPSPIYVNTNAQVLLRPPETDFGDSILPMDTARGAGDPLRVKLRPMSHPLPTPPFRNYPLFTPGREDRRWLGPGGLPNDKAWLGGLMLVAQIVGPLTKRVYEDSPVSKDLQLVIGPGRSQYVSLSWADLDAIAPWMEDCITARIDGAGLGI